MDTPTVPYDVWVCGECKASNYIELAPAVCPVCSHERDYGIGCCSNPGETTWSTGLFSSQHEYQYLPCDEPFDGIPASHSAISSSTRGHGSAVAYDACTGDFNDEIICNEYEVECHNEVVNYPFDACGGSYPIPNAFGPAPGVWTCDECGSSNSAVHGDQCGACGSMRQ